MAVKNPTVTKDQVKESLLAVAELLGKIPTSPEFYRLNQLKGCYSSSVEVLFGKNPYHSLLVYSGLTPSRDGYCSPKELPCHVCGTLFVRRVSEIKKCKRQFCSRSCAGSFNNKNKTHGTRRSKLEMYIEEKLTELYPSLVVLYSDKTTIGSELDIYIPSLQLAFELNGIFHYKPVFGEHKLLQIQNNDSDKAQRCKDHKIVLCSVDTSSQTYFTAKNSQQFLSVVVDLINTHLAAI